MNWIKRILGLFRPRFRDHMGIRGECHIVLTHPDGSKEERLLINTVTELMDAHVADQMSDSGDAGIGWIAVGTGTGQGSASTGLATSLDRNALTSTTQGAGGADNDVIYVGDWAAGDGTGSITEAGVFLSDNNTTMMLYSSFSVITKGASDTLSVTWTGTFGAS
ncbi:hypothetical protein LCGC14_1023610 [marine sediment metagenome]|uniref:Uncharacterized protein n=1 Tax=marine sediment metagenome TaxID=412755 RepID=A0A0F9R2J9_9ZZZZ